jgi:hypothetical protein
MPTKSVAVETDILTAASSTHTNVNYAGSWSVATVTKHTYAHLTIDGSPVVYEVIADFAYIGTDTANNGAPVSDCSRVTLTASPTLLAYGGGSVLVDGDANQDAHGNTVRIESNRHLKTG